jgi:hypothetical protein
MSLSLNDSPAPPKRGLAIASLVIGLISVPTLGLFIVGGVVAVLLGIVALVKIKKEPAAYGGTGLAIGGIVAGAASLALIPVIGILAAVAIPGLSRAAIAGNEVSTIGRMRSIVSAEMIYAMSNGNAYDTLECLAAPATCGQDASSPAYLSPDLLQETASGYRITFVKGAAVDREANTLAKSPSSMDAFAVFAQPERPGVTGVRVFCTDGTGVFRVAPESAAPGAVVGGACPTDWPELQ